MFDEFTQKYNMRKTISIGMIPVGKTSEHVREYIKGDRERDGYISDVKELIDRYHRTYLNKVFGARYILDEDCLSDYYKAFLVKDKKAMGKCVEVMADKLKAVCYQSESTIKGKKVKIVDTITKHPDKMIFEIMANSELYTEEEKESLNRFKKFSALFVRFFKARSTLYNFACKNGECVHSSVAYRLLNENLPRYFYNREIFNLVKNEVGLVDDMGYFTIDGYNLVLNQPGINDYNALLGGVGREDGSHEQGFNEKINLYNQQLGKSSGKKPLPLFKPLYKMPLVKSDGPSFVLDQIENEKDVVEILRNINETFSEKELNAFNDAIFGKAYDFDWSNIFVKVNDIPTVSRMLTGNWMTVEDAWNDRYDLSKSSKARAKDNYTEKRRSEFKKNSCFSISDIASLIDSDVDTVVSTLSDNFKTVQKVSILASVPHSVLNRTGLQFTDAEKNAIKKYLDSIKEFERFVRLFDTESGDKVFDSRISTFSDSFFDGFNSNYNRIRNFCTKKPYSKKKFKLFMGNPDLLDGWALGNEARRKCFILRDKDDKNKIYLAIATSSKIVKTIQAETSSDDYYEKMVYLQIPDASKMLPSTFFCDTYIRNNNVSSELVNIVERRRKGEKIEPVEEQALIDHYKSCISNYDRWNAYKFNFKQSYSSLREFLNDVDAQSYVMDFIHVDRPAIDTAVSSGEILLFRLYNRNFSENSHGRDGAQTRWFKLLFDEKNSRGEYIQLSGGAEMFFRPASLERRVTHVKNQPINNKNPRNAKKTSTFPYDLIKDRRYTEDKFILTLSLKINPLASDNNSFLLNQEIRSVIKESKNQNIIGINRGENNLIYVCVTDGNGKILESKSLNVIDNYDYNDALARRSAKREEERLSWNAISDIKNLKSGYLGKVVHEISELVRKYNAIVVIDNVTSKFIRSRGKIEKNVYQELQKALVNKFSYLASKDIPNGTNGSYMNGLQLANPYKEEKDISSQNGIVFFLSPSHISTVDPTTGFASLLDTRYMNMEKYKEFISKFDKISYDASLGMFRFAFDYKRFLNWDQYPERTDWVAYSNGLRSEFYTDKRSGRKKMQMVDLTSGFDDLLAEYGITSRAGDLKDSILAIDTPLFFKRFANLLSLMFHIDNVSINDGEHYLISPVLNSDKTFYDSREVSSSSLPASRDENAAYNMCRKGIMVVDRIRQCGEDERADIFINRVDWLNFVTT